eukprot:scaffold1659_cov371-Prasinococcus_capsulatus_cf.AAC.24
MSAAQPPGERVRKGRSSSSRRVPAPAWQAGRAGDRASAARCAWLRQLPSAQVLGARIACDPQSTLAGCVASWSEGSGCGLGGNVRAPSSPQAVGP